MKLTQKGMALILFIMIMAVSGILSTSIIWHLVSEMDEVQLRLDRLKAYNMAYAGVMRASFDWANSNATEASRRYGPLDTNLAGTVLGFKTGRPANFAYFSFDLSENEQWTNTSGGGTGALVRLRRFRIRNVHSTTAPSSIIVTGAKVAWSPAGSERLSDIRLNNRSVIPSGGPYVSGTELTLRATDAQRTLASGAVWSGTSTYLQWDSAPSDPVKVTIVWTFKDNDSPAVTDSKTHEVVYWDGCKTAADCDGLGTAVGRPALRTFCITSTGRVSQAGGRKFPLYRSVRATLSGTPAGQSAEIIDWRERDGAII